MLYLLVVDSCCTIAAPCYYCLAVCLSVCLSGVTVSYRIL